jgi:hypothetical protein
MIDNGLKIGELSKSGQVEILDQDRLCYKVISRSKGAYGIRTISKDLLEEFYKLYIDKPDITADEARSLLSGQSAIDKFEYGYASTIWQMAKMLGANRNNSNASLLVKKQYPDNSSAYQIIYYGAPGTGKSHRIKEQLEGVPKENIFRTTFHPDSDYSTFVGAYKPTRSERPLYGLFGKETVRLKDGKDLSEDIITYKFIPQTFLNAYMQAYRKPNENVYLIIEEINRGNCAQIFGDLFQLLDRDEYGVSEYTIKADADLKAFLEDEMGEGNDAIKDGELCLPSNLYIYATMNTSDQSLFPIDSAFKRRWDWEYEPIKYKNTNWVIDIQGETYSWVSFQKEINRRIFESTSSEDKMLGDYFVNPSNGIITEKMLLNKILFYLWNDVCKDGEGDIFKVSDTEDVSFSELYGDGGKQKLMDMMNYLHVEEFGVEVQSESEIQADDASRSIKHKKLTAVILDGIRYEPSPTKFDLYLNVINKIGIDRVAPIVEQSKYGRHGHPLISDRKYEDIENSKGFSYVQVGNFYVVKGLIDDTTINILDLIKSKLQLDLQMIID